MFLTVNIFNIFNIPGFLANTWNTLETNHLHFPKSANTFILNKRSIKNALVLVLCRSSHRCLLLEPLGDISDQARILKWLWMTLTEWRSQKKACHAGRKVRTVCAQKANYQRNALKFVEWELMKVKVDVTFQRSWSKEMQRETAAQGCMFLNKSFAVFYLISCFIIFPDICGIFLCRGRTPLLVAVHPFPGSYMHREGLERGKALPPSSYLLCPLNCCLWEFIIILDLDSEASTIFFFFFSFLVFFSYHMGVQKDRC